MPKQFDHDQNALTEKVLKMGGLTERMIHDTTRILVEWDLGHFEAVAAAEETVDALQREIDEEMVRMISVYTPVASDLRTLLMVTRITAELERIGDQSMNICFYAKELLKQPPLRRLVTIPMMAEISMLMLRDALDAFTERASDLALKVVKTDDKVDRMNDQLFRELMTYVMSDPKTIKQVMELVLTSRAYERIADHAVSIAEDVVFMVRGRDIRHVALPNGDGETGAGEG